MEDLRVETERLLILPMSYSFMTNLLEGTQTDLELQGYLLCEGWVNMEVLSYVDIIRSLMPPEGTVDGFYTWAVIDKHTGMIIGDIGFKGRPNELGIIDIGYGLAPSARGRHIATEAVLAMLQWAFAQPGVRRVSAECLDDNTASVRILKNMGMREMLRDGNTIFWEVKREQFLQPSY